MIDFNRKTKQLLEASSHGRIGIRKFEAIVPSVASQIVSDAGMDWLSFWGQSFNFDEHEHATIVDPKILALIGRIAKTEMRIGNSYHAGLTHTYGYLFSVLKTRYGFKRERWTTGTIEKGLGLPSGVFSPSPRQGTLLSNLTFTLMNIAAGNQLSSDKLTSQIRLTSQFRDLPKGLANHDFSRSKITRITESVEIRSPGKAKASIRIFTDLVRYKSKQPNGVGLLVYSYKSTGPTNRVQASGAQVNQGKTNQGSAGQGNANRTQMNLPKLVTCFPIGQESCQQLLADSRSNSLPIKARYNASIPGFPADGVKGRRSITE